MRFFTRLLAVAVVTTTAACTRQLAPAPIPAAIAPVVNGAVHATGTGRLNVEVAGAQAAATGQVSVDIGGTQATATGQVSVEGAGAQATGRGRLIVDVAEGPVPVYRAHFDARKQDNGARRPTYSFFDLPVEQICKATPCVIDEPPGNILIGFPVLGCEPAIDFDLVHVGLDPSIYRRSLAIFEDETGAERIVGIVAASLGAAASITGMVLVPSGVYAAGGITLGAGALALTAGILMIRHDSASYRPGSANHFEAPISTSPATGATPPARRSPLEVYPYYDCSWGSRRGGTG